MATTGRFLHQGTADELLSRFGAVSQLPTLRYWSTTRQRWRPLVTAAQALERPDRQATRGDFTIEELKSGNPLYFWQEENTPAGEVVYRFRLLEESPDRLVMELDNALPIERFWLTMFRPRRYQFLYWLQRESGEHWTYYSLMRAEAEFGLGLDGHADSLINRAVALYRYTVGLPTDLEPPAAP